MENSSFAEQYEGGSPGPIPDVMEAQNRAMHPLTGGDAGPALEGEPTKEDANAVAVSAKVLSEMTPEQNAAAVAALGEAATMEQVQASFDKVALENVAAAAETAALSLESLTPDTGAPVPVGEDAYFVGVPENGTLPIRWRGQNITGDRFQGYAANTRQASEDANAVGSVTCHCSPNPNYCPKPVAEVLHPETAQPSEVVAKIAEEAVSAAVNQGYRAGYEDADAAYQDLKTLVLAWATEEIVAGRINGTSDEPAFVTYARHNR